MKQEFYFPSADGKSRIHAVRHLPQGQPKAILQIVHGMAEYIERYDEFAAFLARQGFLVVGHDHLGHGKTAESPEALGYFAELEGNRCVIGDIHALREQTRAEYPGIPYFLMGHSMGSFLVRQYLGDHHAGLSGAVIMGTGDPPMFAVRAARGLCPLIARFRGWHHRSGLLNMTTGGAFELSMGKAWLSRSEENVRRYVADPLCGFVFTLNGFYNLFTGLQIAKTRERAGQIPKALPLLFVSGAEDPVGGKGKAVQALYERYEAAGARDVTLGLYPGDRHELLQEEDRQAVFADILAWLETRL